jgi:EmrB/QacA subfamily drug resistance transporter
MDSASILAQQDRKRWGALAIVIAAQFMVILDVAIVNVALPSIKDDLGFSEASLQWVITAYAIVFGGALLLGGRLADIFGRRRVFLLGMGLFTVSSLLSGLAWSEAALIGSRALQGLGGALLAPAALSILMTTFSEGRERNLALGIWGAASGSGAAAGVLLGGVLTSYLDWSWIFFINIPVGVAVMALTPFLLAESRAEVGHRHFDLTGAVTVTSGVMLLVYAMTRAAEDGWLTLSTLGLLVASLVLIAAFLVVELRTRMPLLPLRIFRLRSLAVANATAVLVAAVAFSEFFLLTLYLQQVLDFSPMETGVAFLPITLTIIVVSNIAQTLVTRIGVRPVLTTGLLLAAVALAYFVRLPADGEYLRDVLPALVLSGVGLALTFVPMTIAGLTGVERADAGVASGLINTSRQIGGAVGLAAVSTIAITASSGAAGDGSAAAGAALTHGFQVSFAVLAVLAVVGAVLVAALIEPRRPRGADVPVLHEEPTVAFEEAA